MAKVELMRCLSYIKGPKIAYIQQPIHSYKPSCRNARRANFPTPRSDAHRSSVISPSRTAFRMADEETASLTASLLTIRSECRSRHHGRPVHTEVAGECSTC